MSKWTIYHNPRCSKSRETLALLEKNKIEPTIVEYLKKPLSSTQLQNIAKMLALKPKEFLRKKEAIFKELKVDIDNDKAVISAMAKHPTLIERPIVVKGKKAVLGRPPENIKSLL